MNDVIERAKKLEDQIDNDNDATSVERCASELISELLTLVPEEGNRFKKLVKGTNLKWWCLRPMTTDKDARDWIIAASEEMSKLSYELEQALVPEDKEEWNPNMDEAPKDGTDVYVFHSKWLQPCPAYFVSKQYLKEEYEDENYMEEAWYPSCGFLFDLPECSIYPTHWKPITLPKQEQSKPNKE